jgi:hypothetical protein
VTHIRDVADEQHGAILLMEEISAKTGQRRVFRFHSGVKSR